MSASKATNISLNSDLVKEARALGVNISKACEAGLSRQVAEARAAKWLEENKEAIAEYNAYIEKNGVPLSEYRQF